VTRNNNRPSDAAGSSVAAMKAVKKSEMYDIRSLGADVFFGRCIGYDKPRVAHSPWVVEQGSFRIAFY